MNKFKAKFLNKKFIKEFIWINIGVFLTAFSFTFFLDPNKIVCGGVGGLATILTNTLFKNLSPSVIILSIDVVLLLFGLIFLGKEFFIKTLYGSLVYPFYTFIAELLYNIMPINPASDSEILVTMLFSACITGCGMGLSIRNGGSTGGIDIPQNILLKYFKVPLSVSLIIFDGTIVLLGASFFGGFTHILYGILFIVISGYVLDNVVFGGFNVRAVHIISKKHEEIKNCIIHNFDRTVTEVYAKGGYTEVDTKMLICVLTNKEYYHLRSIIMEYDSKAFVYVVKATEVAGAGFSYEKR